jgi:hypothetical protein
MDFSQKSSKAHKNLLHAFTCDGYRAVQTPVIFSSGSQNSSSGSQNSGSCSGKEILMKLHI